MESNSSGTFTFEFIFAAGRRIARRNISNSAVSYFFSDDLGSTDKLTNASGTIQNDSEYYPYGGERVYTQGATNQNYKFTGKERDGESGLDNFGARYDSSSLGRFMTPDWAARPVAIPYAVLGDPQSLNLYGYVRNDPVGRADADGHDANDWMGWRPGPGGASSDAGDAPQHDDVNWRALVTSQAGGVTATQLQAADQLMAQSQAPQQQQPQRAQNQGEGSQANLSRREGIADAAVETKQRSDLGQKQYGPNQCSAFVAGCIAKAGAKAEFDSSGRPPVAGEWANKNANIPDFRPLKPGEKPVPGDVAAVHILNPHPGATGDSAIVVMRGNRLSAIQAGDHGVEYNSNFIHGYKDVVYWRYTGD